MKAFTTASNSGRQRRGKPELHRLSCPFTFHCGNENEFDT
ncbi:MAG: hypothetical protein ACJAY2_001073, partial [Pseudomonadales bacterium]